jgi:phasin family protein
MYPVTLNPFPLRQCATAVEAVFDCTNEFFGGFERVVELNVQTAKASISEQQAFVDAVLSARSPSELIDLHSQQLSAAVKKTNAYWRHLEDVTVETANRFFTAMYAHSGSFLKRFVEMIDIAPGGVAAGRDRTSLLVSGQQLAAEPAAIVDSSGKVLSSRDAQGDLY